MNESSEKPAYIVLDHTADLALRVYGRSLEELFANAARGMFAQMVMLENVSLAVKREVSVEGDDLEMLLVAWLSELLYLRETYREAYTRFYLHFPSPSRLDGIAEGGPCDAFERPIKAVTFHGLTVEQQAGSFQATIVFDV